jgi:hypothetical protein
MPPCLPNRSTKFFTVDSEILSIIDESGAVSATAQAGYPAVIDFDAIAHFASTSMNPISLHHFKTV